MKDTFCVIMAGGVGSRFWPLSCEAMPKQFLDILGTGKSFIRSTYERFLPIVPIENFFIVTNEDYKQLVLQHIPELKEEQVLCEPMRRNTAPCIAYASYKINKINPNANIIVTPADHLVTNEAEFQRVANQGLEFVKGNDKLLTIGIRPSRPETGYGYIQHDKQNLHGEFACVKTFTEKPNRELAEAFVKSGEFFWNSGIFVWSARAIIESFQNHLYDMSVMFESGVEFYGTDKEHDFIKNLYTDCTSISIDYGVMEKAKNVYVIAADFGWSDIGTWGSLYNYSPQDENKNCLLNGKAMMYNTQNSIVNIAGNKVAVVDGLDGFLVIDTPERLLICRMEREQSIRSYVEDINFRFGEDYI